MEWLRNDLGLTQTQMAEELGLKLRAYQEIEGGKATLRRMHILAAERVALAHGAKGKIGEGSMSDIVSFDWYEQLMADAKAFTDPLV
ncbi:hypothetical protein X727_15685 [Mesorhizobium sp. L103C119B0]|nr:hypothetical protein X735_01430 [Mesorhizobium sp. L2C085B000]ESZ69803.1 hypothetical protein X727_15685 [Mesorhizobium sp. L103C119B0]ESZ78528.1 hypothetical protein X726_05040 [Mesorhizobium sp. L103C105A0]